MSALSFHRYELPLTNGNVRHGLLLQSSGAWGDAAPLRGWSSETCDDLLRYLSSDPNLDAIPANLPSLQCAMEGVMASAENFQNWPVLHNEVPINALLQGTVYEIIDQAKRALREGCRCLKIKTTHVPLDALPHLLTVIRDVSECTFRLDSNRAWGFSTCMQVAEDLQGLAVEYLEEPLRKGESLPQLIAQCPIPIALDETLREIGADELSRYRGAVALVLKPTLMGGFATCSRFAEVGASLGMKSVVSACYESGVGIFALGRFASSLESISAAGLDTYSHIKKDLLTKRLSLDRYSFCSSALLPSVDESTLLD